MAGEEGYKENGLLDAERGSLFNEDDAATKKTTQKSNVLTRWASQLFMVNIYIYGSGDVTRGAWFGHIIRMDISSLQYEMR